MLTQRFTRLIFLASLMAGMHSTLFSSLEENPTALSHTANANYIHLPLSFEKNEGQTNDLVKYFSHKRDYSLYFTPDEVILALPNKSSSTVLKIQFIGASPNPVVQGMEEQESKSNYFIGNDSNQWLTNISHFAKVCYKDLYPGIDVVFYGNDEQLEYDICVAPGSDPQNIHMHIEGSKALSIDDSGNLQILTEDDQELLMLKPFVYQVSDGEKISIEGKFVLLAQQEISFLLGTYDTNKSLIIDPILSYSTFLGGSGDDMGFGITTDNKGNVYVTGSTNSPNFPVTAGAYQPTLIGSANCFITKLNIAGSKLVYSTYLGSSTFRGDTPAGIAVDSEGNAYVLGTTDSATFPTTMGAYQTDLKGLTNCFITKLNPTGSGLVYSTYLGGSAEDFGDVAGNIAIDSSGHAYVCGGTHSTDFPTTMDAYQGALAGTNTNCFITKFNTTGTNLVYSTYLGGSITSSNGDSAFGIAVDGSGNAYITGSAQSSNFPTTVGAFQTNLAGTTNCFVTKLNPTGSSLVYSTYLGGSIFDYGQSITVDGNGNAYVTGATGSSDFPFTDGAFQTSLNGTANAFVTKFNEIGSALVYSTYLGGSLQDDAFSIAIDSSGNSYVAGAASSPDFPITSNAFQSTLLGMYNCFITKLNNTGSNLVYSTYLGGNAEDIAQDIALDSSDNIYITGFTASTDFPVTANAFQTALPGALNAFISIFTFNSLPPSNFQGKATKNVFLSQTDYINQLSWTPNLDPGVIGYKIFRDGSLIAIIPASGPFVYDDHNRTKNEKYIYTIVSTNASGSDSQPSSITLN